MRTILAASAFALAPLCGAGATEPTSITIHVTRADLANEASLADLYARIHDAAVRLCKYRDSTAPLMAGAEQSCRRSAIEDAIREANIAPLSVYHTALSAAKKQREISATLASN